jgi:hypothetical protein
LLKHATGGMHQHYTNLASFEKFKFSETSFAYKISSSL